MEKLKEYAGYIGSGGLMTALTGLYGRDTTGAIVGVTKIGYGLPLQWMEKVTVVYPGSPMHYSLNPLGLLVDVVLWSMVIRFAYAAYKQRGAEKEESELK